MHSIKDLAAAIGQHATENGISSTALKRLSLIRAEQVSEPIAAVYEASLCLIAQGSKRVSLAEHSVVYDPASYLIISVDLPVVGHILEACVEEPYLCCKIDLDMAVVAEMVAHDAALGCSADLPALAVYPSEPELIDAVCRFVRLLDQPAAIGALSPLIEREILYRLLTGPHGAMLRQFATANSRLNQISRAIAMIRQGFHEQLRIQDIAAEAGMSLSSLHAHFKAVTRMTPLEYQKTLRLQEARHLMLMNGASAGTAGYAVGYDSQSQFSREYRRLFGAPPKQDIERMLRA